MQIGKGKQGVLIGEYGFSRPQDKKTDTADGGGTLGWIEPACDNPQWILWFDPKGDAVLYTERETGLESKYHDQDCLYRKGVNYPCTCGGPKEEHQGAVVGEPIRLFARTKLETKQQKEIKRLKDEVKRLMTLAQKPPSPESSSNSALQK
jgi:hypothetical protein